MSTDNPDHDFAQNFNYKDDSTDQIGEKYVRIENINIRFLRKTKLR